MREDRDNRDGGYGRESRDNRDGGGYGRGGGGRDSRESRDNRGGNGGGGDGRRSSRSKFRSEYPVDFVFEFKDPVSLGRFMMEGGKIIPSRISKLSMAQQRCLTLAVKRARHLALMPMGTDAYDYFSRPEQISPKPFEF